MALDCSPRTVALRSSHLTSKGHDADLPARKPMRAAVIALVVCFVLPIASSANEAPQSGTWRVDETRTWWSDGPPPKGFSLALILQFSGSTFEYRSINDTDKSKPPQEFQFATTLDGAAQAVPDRKAGDFDQISFEKVEARHYRMLRWLKGELVAVQFWAFSAEGKELVRRGATKTASGAWHAYEELFVRQ